MQTKKHGASTSYITSRLSKYYSENKPFDNKTNELGKLNMFNEIHFYKYLMTLLPVKTRL